MIRSFLPVEQGAFYLEQFKEFDDRKINVIYDCGSLTSKKIVESEIKSNLYEGEEILFVFISHLDADHVNGLEFLLKYCNVKNIIFPLTSKQDRYLLSLKYLCDSDENNIDDFSFRFISNPHETLFRISDNIRVFAIRSFENNDREERYYDEEGNIDNLTIIRSGSNILEIVYSKKSLLHKYWEYVPFNFRFKERSIQITEALENNLPRNIKIENVIDLWGYKSIQSAVKKAYREIDGAFNANSMTLFSGIRTSEIWQTFILPFNLFKCRLKYSCIEQCLFDIKKSNGCLYTGDFDAKSNWNELYRAYEAYWKYIGCIQVPHHGSYKNYNENLSKFDAFYIISVGQNNAYRHPTGSVVKSLIYNRKYPFIVTERREKEVFFEVSLKSLRIN